MPNELIEDPPHTTVEPVSEVLHGISVVDPYRWLEDQDSLKTRSWIAAQTRYARSCLDSIPGRERIRERVCGLLDVETYDSILRAGNRFFFRKRLSGFEQPCIFSREGLFGEDRLLIDPAERLTGRYTSVKPLQVSPDGKLLLYEVKQGGERTAEFEICDVESRSSLPDRLPRGWLRGFSFAANGDSFLYVHQPAEEKEPSFHAARQHGLGTSIASDQEIFRVDGGRRVRLTLLSDHQRILFAVFRFFAKKISDFYLSKFHDECSPRPLLVGIDYLFAPQFANDRILAVTDRNAPNRRIVEIPLEENTNAEWTEIVPQCGMVIQDWLISGNHIFVSYLSGTSYQIRVFDLSGRNTGEIPISNDETARLLQGASFEDEVLLETESFLRPITISCYSAKTQRLTPIEQRHVPFDSAKYGHTRVEFRSTDGMTIPMFLVGRRDVLDREQVPTIMTAYGGFAKSMTPQFSVLVALLMERSCLFALPNIRGGLENGISWHEAAKGPSRVRAIEDFLSAAEWLIANRRTEPGRLGIFGGSNSGLLVGAAMVRRPDLFRAVLCIAPLLDMFRYHLFDSAALWSREFGTAENQQDFLALRQYSPYQLVKKGTEYPAVMLISGDADQNCNPLHARKMTARLQDATSSNYPVILDYSEHRGHSPVLPLSTRIDALTDRLAFLCSQLRLPENNGENQCC